MVRARWSPNAISIAGMLCCTAAGAALAATPHLPPWPARACFVAAAALVQLRLLANLFDGMVAIESGVASAVGELYNDIPDRVSDAATLIGLGYATGGWSEMSYIAAMLAILTAYIRAVGKAAGAGSHFRGPMAKQQRMFLVTMACVTMAFTPTSWWGFWGPRDDLGIPAVALILIAAGSALTCLRRLAGIASKLKQGPA